MWLRLSRVQAIALAAVYVCSGTGLAATVTVDASRPLAIVPETAFGLHTSVYDNQNANASLPSLLVESGVSVLRYPGGGYADVFHWSSANPLLQQTNGYGGLTPWWGQPNNYGYMGPQTGFSGFLNLLTNTGAQAVITIDYGSAVTWNASHSKLIVPATNAQPQEAAAWVAYANASSNILGTANDVTIGVDALGNNWKTAGYWAALRAAKPLGTDDGYNFLRINRVAPVGIKYWEIGNETFGTGYYDGSTTGYSINYSVPYTTNSRLGQPSLSPAFYGRQVNQFAQAMKAVDSTIKIGAVVSTPPGDYSWDIYNGQRWTPQVLQQCASNIDFVIAHWYPDAGNNADGTGLLSQIGPTLPLMINGATPGLDSGTNAGLRDWINTYRPTDGTNVQIFITEFGYTGTVTNSVLGPANALFAADCYASWIDLGVANVDYLEMNKTAFLGDSSPLVRGAAFYGIKLVRALAGPGDTMITAASDDSTLSAHAVLRQDGKLGLLLINESLASNQTVNVTITNAVLAASGVQISFGANSFPANNQTPSSGLVSNTLSGLSNAFSVMVPAYSMVELIVPTVTNTPPVWKPIADQNIVFGATLMLTSTATDTDQPPQLLTFSLLAGPTNATLTTVSPTNALFAWRPMVGQADSTNLVTLKVADNGTPSLSATQSFEVVVGPVLLPTLGSFGLSNGQAGFQITGAAGPDYAVQVSSNLVNWSTVLLTNSPLMPFGWMDTNTANAPMRFYRIKIGPPLP